MAQDFSGIRRRNHEPSGELKFGKIYNIASCWLPVAYLALAIIGHMTLPILMLSSAAISIAGVVVVVNYTGPRGSSIGDFILGPPPRLSRWFAIVYGFIAVVTVLIIKNS